MSHLTRGPVVTGIGSKANGLGRRVGKTRDWKIHVRGGDMSHLTRGPVVTGIGSKANGLGRRVGMLCIGDVCGRGGRYGS